MHPKNRYHAPHDFPALAAIEPELAGYLITTPDDRISLDFAAPRAVYLLNRTLLRRDYGMKNWSLPEGHLVPPVPGRLDYIHALADLCPGARRVMDIGTGAGLIYPILGVYEYNWSFLATEIDPAALRNARAIATHNGTRLKRRVTLRLQEDADTVFAGIVKPDESFDACMCNPPFFSSRSDAREAARQKWRKLGRDVNGLSFGGTATELHTRGGELGFLRRMIAESRAFARQFGWFTSLVSKGGYVRALKPDLDRAGAEYRIIPMGQGNKRSRILAWRYQ